MSRRFAVSLAAIASAAVLAVTLGGRAGAEEPRCYGDWSDAAPIVAREKLRSARDVQDMARGEMAGDVVRILLCEADGGFVYRLVLRRLDGRIGTLTVSARPRSQR
jgi:uncharacterized membrane protein YkoI